MCVMYWQMTRMLLCSRDINFAQALERLRQKKFAKDAALEIIMDFLAAQLRPKIA